MSFQNRREFLFVYSVKDANPNGDPLNANQPRFDPESGQILVSDVRVKRTVRDYWLQTGQQVFVDSELKTLDDRADEVAKATGEKEYRAAMSRCIDVRLFGVTFSSKKKKEPFAWTGPVQFKWGRSLHKAKVEFIQGTAAFATGAEKGQRSFRNEYLTPFALLAVYGIANQNAAQTTGAGDADLDALREGLWMGTINLISRSKIGHQPRLLLEVRYKAGFLGSIGALDEKVRLECDGRPLEDEEQLALRDARDVSLSLASLAERIQALNQEIEAVTIWRDRELRLAGLEALEGLGNRLVVKEK